MGATAEKEMRTAMDGVCRKMKIVRGTENPYCSHLTLPVYIVLILHYIVYVDCKADMSHPWPSTHGCEVCFVHSFKITTSK